VSGARARGSVPWGGGLLWTLDTDRLRWPVFVEREKKKREINKAGIRRNNSNHGPRTRTDTVFVEGKGKERKAEIRRNHSDMDRYSICPRKMK
jgi:hypothetical protein